MLTSDRFGLALLESGQAQKEVTHNEAIVGIDVLMHPVVTGGPVSDEPTSPLTGATYIVASGATGAFAGQDDHLAAYTSGGWRFLPPVEGMCAHDGVSGLHWRFANGLWEEGVVAASEVRIAGDKVVGRREAAIESASGGAVIDSEARGAIDAILSALRNHGLIEI